MKLLKNHKYLLIRGNKNKIISYHWWRKTFVGKPNDQLIDLTFMFNKNYGYDFGKHI